MEQSPFVAWVSEVAYRLGLTEWELEVETAELPDDVVARCVVPRARKLAKILVCENFRELPPEEQRATIVHELLHCHFAAMVELVEELPPLLGKPAYSMFDAAFDLQFEQALDAVAVSVAALVPLPPEVE